MHSVCVDLQVCAGGYTHQLIKLHVNLQSDLVLYLCLGDVPMDGISYMCTISSMLLNIMHVKPTNW